MFFTSNCSIFFFLFHEITNPKMSKEEDEKFKVSFSRPSTSNPTTRIDELTHRQCLDKICIFCYEKTSTVRLLTENVEKKVKKLDSTIDIDAHFNPKAICGGCRQQLDRPNKKLLLQKRNSNLPHIDELSLISVDSPDCKCKICQTVKTKRPLTKTKKTKKGRPPKPKVQLVCKNCQSADCDGKSCKTRSLW